jgi:hypothetical protein
MNSSSFLLFIFYSLLISVAVLKLDKLKVNGISPTLLLAIFWSKVLSGIAYVLIHQWFYDGGDVLGFNKNAAIISSALPHETANFFQLLIYPGGDYIPTDLLWYIKHTKYWSDKGTYFLIKIIVLFNLFSKGNIYVNTLFFEALTLPGLIALYKVAKKYAPTRHWLLLVAIFGIPQVVFWGSGIHKDGLIMSAMGWIIYSVDLILHKSWKFWPILLGLFSILLMGIIRSYDLLLMFPGLLALAWCNFQPAFSFLKSVLLYVIFFACFFLLDGVLHLGLLNFMIQKQQLFLYFNQAQSAFTPLPLTANWWSFVSNAPMAIFRTISTPSNWSTNSNIEKYATLEHLIYLLIAFIGIGYGIKNKHQLTPFTSFCFWYSISLFLFIGWLVPNSGSMIRYSAAPFLFFSLAIALFVSNSAESDTKARF